MPYKDVFRWGLCGFDEEKRISAGRAEDVGIFFLLGFGIAETLINLIKNYLF